MPMTVTNPRDLFLTELSDLLFVERQLAFEVIPELLKQVTDPTLTRALAEHLEVTKRHAHDLEGVFRSVGAEPGAMHSFAFAGLEHQHSSRSASIVTPSLADVFHAGAAAHAEHYEIAAYRTLIALARAIANDNVRGMLERNLADEQDALATIEQAVEQLAVAQAPPPRSEEG